MNKQVLLSIFFLVFTTHIFSQDSVEELSVKLQNTTDKKTQLEILNDITKKTIREESERKVKFLKQYLALAKELKEYDKLGNKSRFLIEHFTSISQLDSTKYYVDQMLEYLPLYKDPTTEAHILLKRASYYYNTDQYEKAITDYNRSGDIFIKENKGLINAADARLFAAQVYNDLNDFLNAVTYYESAYKLYDELKDNFYKNFTLSELAGIYSQNGFLEKAIAERKRVLANAKEIKDYPSLYYAYGNLAKISQKAKNYDDVKKYIDSTTIYSDSITNKQQKVLSQLFLANLKVDYNLDLNNITLAEKYLEEAKGWVKKTSAPDFFQRMNYEYQGKVYVRKKDYAKAENAFKKVLALKGQNGQEEKVKKAEKEIAKVYGATGQYKKAFEHLNTYLELEEADNKLIKDNTFLYYQSKFETERKDQEIFKRKTEIELLEKDKEIEKYKRRVTVALLLIALLIAFMIFYVLWRKAKRKRRALAREIVDLNTEVTTKKEEVNELLTETIIHLRSKEKLAENLSKLSHEEEGVSLKSIIADLKADKLEDSKIVFLKQNIESLNYEFLKNLKNIHPNLTKTDIEVCSFIKIGLSRKEISNLRKTSLDAIKSTRFRLKKKLNLTSEDSLDDYIKSI
ncbi:tetratricopeptide repeat protein [uncultured Tenacibaculum sp.]|uniref:tetratricopeptide repeat protein n=1 Tax=uncultured Tenacibaculum sp. TaxID=174713 RepID=UPI002604DC3F|nr:tetratricopeptide repeat protein [uncultured Tenacibaculum sp.]